MEKYCNNCGNTGHYYKDCKFPILSYGIILFDNTNKDNIKIVLIERKHSLSYIEFLRGKYDVNNDNYIQLLFNRMSKNEKQDIVSKDFNNLWNNLWNNYDNVNQRIKNEYSVSKKKFNNLKYHDKLSKFNNNCIIHYEENEWEIPKGRRNNREVNKHCAIREFQEETNISSDNYSIIHNILPLSEEYKGINNVNYKHYYYVAKIHKYMDLKIEHTNKNQCMEVNSIKWCNRKECLEKIRDYSIEKVNIINNFFDFIEKIDQDKLKKM